MALAVEEKLDNVEASLCKNYPSRAQSIKLAFAAHRRGEFELSMPSLFSQADGICFDALSIQPFSNKDGSRLRDKIERPNPGTFGELYFRPLFDADDIRKNSKKVPTEKLNRHAVMHGNSTTRYTRINSLKIISFIGNLDWFLEEFRQAKESSLPEEQKTIVPLD